MSAAFVVVSGTDTGVGKTFVSTALSRAWVREGRRVVAVKPLETGCGEEISEAEDGVALARATGQSEPRAAIVRLRDPLTPALAAERQGVALDIEGLVERVKAFGRSADVVLVEGAGGIASPLSWDRDITHVARDLDARILIVAADRLGTLSHVKTAIQYLFDGGQSLAGTILSTPTVDSSTGTNAASLEKALTHYGDIGKRMVTVPHGATDLDRAMVSAIDRWVFETT